MMSYKIIYNNMNTISVPLPKDLEKFIESYIKSGEAENKAQVVRKALRKLSEERVWSNINEGLRDIDEGRVYKGDLRELLKKF